MGEIEELKKYSFERNKNIKKILIDTEEYNMRGYTFGCVKNKLISKNIFEIFIYVGYKNSIASLLLYKTFKNGLLSSIYYKRLKFIVSKKDINLIMKLVKK